MAVEVRLSRTLGIEHATHFVATLPIRKAGRCLVREVNHRSQCDSAQGRFAGQLAGPFGRHSAPSYSKVDGCVRRMLIVFCLAFFPRRRPPPLTLSLLLAWDRVFLPQGLGVKQRLPSSALLAIGRVHFGEDGLLLDPDRCDFGVRLADPAAYIPAPQPTELHVPLRISFAMTERCPPGGACAGTLSFG